jgi:hypothetical protein
LSRDKLPLRADFSFFFRFRVPAPSAVGLVS